MTGAPVLRFKGAMGKRAQEACRARDRIQADALALRLVGLTAIADRIHQEASEMADIAKEMYEASLNVASLRS